MSQEHKLSYYIAKANSLATDKFDKKIRIAILSSFTINGLEEAIRVKCSDCGVQCISYVGGYNQYAQEILEPKSNLYHFNSDITFLIIDIRSLLGDYFYFSYSISVSERKKIIDTKFDELKNLINAFAKNSTGKLIVANFDIPSFSPYGIAENKTEYGIQEMISVLNKKLISEVSDSKSVFVYDFNKFVTKHGEENIFDYRKFLFGDIKVSLDFIPHLANDLMGYLKAVLGLTRKCIVVDLDNTLWGGVVGEDGFDGIKLEHTSPGNAYVEFQKLLLSFWHRGILLAINSKNNYDDAIQVIKEHPYMILREENFASIQINWNDKVSNMKKIVEDLNIGLNSLVFFDDDPVNRELVSTHIPEILTVNVPNDPSLYAKTLMELNDFNLLQITDEDIKRGKMYQQQKVRKELQKTATNLDEFLKQLDIKITIKNATQFTIPRISQLTLKTNQFNLTTKRYQEEEIVKFSKDNTKLVGCAQVEDKFGDNGITGVFIISKDNPTEWNIDTFLLSCRVMGRGVEDAIMAHILQKARDERVKKVNGFYLPSKKNMPCENFLSNYGFSKNGDFWSFSLSNQIKIPNHIKLVSE